ncbi:MAG: phage shock protein PspA [Colwellia sp.]
MGLFTRFTDIVNANLNSMLDKAEEPEKMIRLIVQEMEETLVEVRATAAKNIAEKKSLNRKSTAVKNSIGHWVEKANLALEKGREDLAKSAIAQKHKLEAELVALEKEELALDGFLNEVQVDAQSLQTKLSEAKRRQEAYVLRQQSAVVRLKTREKSAVYNIDEAMNKFDRYQEKIEAVEAQIEAFDMTQNQDLSAQIDALAKDEAIENELAAMKKSATKKKSA